MKCKTCNQEVKQIGATIKVKELNIEVQTKVTQKNVGFDNLVTPKDWRLMTYIEAVELANSDFAKVLKMDGSSLVDDFFIQQPFNLNKKNGYVAGFSADSDGAVLNCFRNPQYSNSDLGVRFVRDIKQVNKQ